MQKESHSRDSTGDGITSSAQTDKRSFLLRHNNERQNTRSSEDTCQALPITQSRPGKPYLTAFIIATELKPRGSKHWQDNPDDDKTNIQMICHCQKSDRRMLAKITRVYLSSSPDVLGPTQLLPSLFNYKSCKRGKALTHPSQSLILWSISSALFSPEKSRSVLPSY